MNYYSHHIGDYRRDTAHLSLLEHGVYRQLLDMYYLSESKIPAETELVYRRLCARTDEEKSAVDTVLSEFFVYEEGWVHSRCEREIAKYQGKADRARDNGKLGGRPKKTKAVISENQNKTETKANQEPITTNQEPISKQGKRKRFLQPTVEEVRAYCQDRMNTVDPERWHNHYTSNGWMVGKNPMKDWQAAVRKWEDGNETSQQDRRSRTKRVSDELDRIARESILREGSASGSLDGRAVQAVAGQIPPQMDLCNRGGRKAGDS